MVFSLTCNSAPLGGGGGKFQKMVAPRSVLSQAWSTKVNRSIAPHSYHLFQVGLMAENNSPSTVYFILITHLEDKEIERERERKREREQYKTFPKHLWLVHFSYIACNMHATVTN